jgi:cupin 2 domain-containing protein
MAEADLQRFLHKVRQLNAFVTLTEECPELLRALRDCRHHHQVVDLARSCGFEIGRRWGEEDSPPEPGQLLAGPCPPAGEESSTVLLSLPGMRLERIHSCEAASPEGFWYDQPEHEWVCLLQGKALLRFADEESARQLKQGDCLLITPHRRHRLEATDPWPGSIWLALFWDQPSC